MIDFAQLNKLIRSARSPSAGKPLDNVEALNRHHRRHSGMRSCRLFQVNDTDWRIELHGNTIARISQQADGTAIVSIHNVEDWPTMTTAERVGSVLGRDVWKQDNKLRGRFDNVTHIKEGRSFRQFPPLMNGQKFHITDKGVFCINPEIVTEQRTRVLKEPSKPVLAYLRKIKQLGVVLARVEAVQYRDLLFPNGPKLPIDSYDVEVDSTLALRVMAVGAAKQEAYWRLNSMVERGVPMTSSRALAYLEGGLRHYKDNLYAHHGVYEKYTHSFANHFTEYKYGTDIPLALAA